MFDQLAIPYCVGGSFSSSIYGEVRATRDVDIIAGIEGHHVPSLHAAMAASFFIQIEDILDAVLRAPTLQETPRERATFSLLHRTTFFKADIFVSSGRPFDQSQFQRRVAIEIAPGEPIAVASAEDTILAKLEWYRIGNEISDRQWRDLRAVLTVQTATLDYAYLRTWATRLGVRDLLDRAMSDQPPPEATPTQQSLL
ncbi:hypothetical protein F8S13_26960 [Chloroflexia bacterium SDU3-3]|nr:hypothetical protein F8S13_26960 [Chloroflexia bacterium SDU3-3]